MEAFKDSCSVLLLTGKCHLSPTMCLSLQVKTNNLNMINKRALECIVERSTVGSL